MSSASCTLQRKSVIDGIQKLEGRIARPCANSSEISLEYTHTGVDTHTPSHTHMMSKDVK